MSNIQEFRNSILCGDAVQVLRSLPSESIHCCVTSPPYWGLRDYGVQGQIGLEGTVQEYITGLMSVFNEVYRVLRNDGTLWVNLGDSYTSNGRKRRAPDIKNQARSMSMRPDTPDGLKSKDLVGIPWRVAFALQNAGWYLRSDIIWEKPNCMPESVKDRPTRSHEYVFLLSKSPKYYYDQNAVREPSRSKTPHSERSLSFARPVNEASRPGQKMSQHREGRTVKAYGGDLRNQRSVWSISTAPFKEAHFAVFPEKLVEPCILAGCPDGGIVLDPFSGSGTTALVARRLSRQFIGIELNPEYVEIARKRLEQGCAQAEVMI